MTEQMKSKIYPAMKEKIKGLKGSFHDTFEEAVEHSNILEQEEPVSEELEEASDKYAEESYPDEPSSGQFGTGDYEPYIDMSAQREIAKEDFKAGAEWQIAKLMEEATEAVVAIDSGGYPYIDKTIELYDYDKDVPLAKKGDKYKVILIKED